MSGPDPHNLGHNVFFEQHQPEHPSSINPAQTPPFHEPERCYNCGCEVRQNIGEGRDDSIDADSYLNGRDRMRELVVNGDANDDDTNSVQGDEGLEENKTEATFPGGHLVQIPGHGIIPLWAINQGLARHEFCVCLAHCHGGIPEDDVSGASTPGLPRIVSTSSLTVEVSSGDISMQSSGYLPPRTPSPTVFEFMGGLFHLETPIYYFTSGPLWLSPHSMGHIHNHETQYTSPHPQQLHIGEDDESDDGMWHTVRALPN